MPHSNAKEIIKAIRAVAHQYHMEYNDDKNGTHYVGHTCLAAYVLNRIDFISDPIYCPKPHHFTNQTQYTYCMAFLYAIDHNQQHQVYHYQDFEHCYTEDKEQFFSPNKPIENEDPDMAQKRTKHNQDICDNELKKNFAEQCALELCQIEAYRHFKRASTILSLYETRDLYNKINQERADEYLAAGYLEADLPTTRTCTKPQVDTPPIAAPLIAPLKDLVVTQPSFLPPIIIDRRQNNMLAHDTNGAYNKWTDIRNKKRVNCHIDDLKNIKKLKIQ